MKTTFKFLLIIILVGAISVIYVQFNNTNAITKLSKINNLRETHENYLLNSPFKETLQLSKAERKSRGIPPNKYYEREWELTMNPATGLPEPNKVLNLQKQRNSTIKRAPGDGDVTNNWVDRGPNNVGGRTRVVLFDPNDVDYNRVFAGGVSGGLWVNEDITNENSSWTLVPGVPSNMNISCITVDPLNSNVWYIGTGEQYTYGAAVGNGVYKTTDGGANWVNIPVQLAGGGTSGTDFAGIYYINDIIAWNNNGTTQLFIGVGTNTYRDASNPSNYLGYQNAGLYTSTNGGNNWSRIETPALELIAGIGYYIIPNDFEISADNTTLWMGTINTSGSSGGGGKIFKTIDGAKWKEALASPLPFSDRVEIAVSSSNSNKIYALTQGTTTTGNNAGPHIYVTTDAFSTVVELKKPEDADSDIPANDFTRGQAFYDLVIEVDPTNDDIVYVGGIDLFRTSAGNSITASSDWKQISKWTNANGLENINCAIVHADQHAFTFRPGNANQAVIGCDGGVYFASDLVNAESSDVISVRNKDYNVTQFYYGSYGQDVNNELMLAGAQDNGTQYITATSKGVNSSIEVNGGDGAFSEIDKDGNYMIVSYIYNDSDYIKLPYNGTSLYEIDGGTPQEGDFINQATLDHHLNIVYSNGGNKINRYKLGDQGLIGTKDQLSNALLTGSPTAFKVSPESTTSTILFVGTDNSKLLKINNADELSGIITWEEITGPSFIGSVSDIEFGANENEIFVTMHNYGVTSIWYSANGGTDWVSKEGNLPDMPVKCILPSPLNANEVIVGTELGIWSTKNFNNASPTWVSSYNGMRDVKVVDLDIRTADNSILATTFGRGLFTGKFSSPEFTITSSTTTVTSCSNSAVFNFNLNTYPAYATKTNFTVSGAPSGVNASFSPTSLNGVGTFTMTLDNIGSLAIGEYPMTVTGTGLETNSIDVILKIVDATTLSSVTTIAPLNEATAISNEAVNFEWNAIAEATSYTVEISTDAGFSSIIESETTTINSYKLQSTLTAGTVYYWRVRAVNDCVTADFSEVQKFQTQLNCNNFSNSTSIPIPDGAGAGVEGTPVISTINIPSSIILNDVNVTVNITHTYIEDLKLVLKSPSGTQVVLYANNCGGQDNINVIFDDAGTTAINCGSLFQEVVTPLSALLPLNAENAQGDWTLTVTDNYNNDTGTLNSWAIEVCETVTSTNSTLLNTGFTVGTTTPYVLLASELKASSVGSLASEQLFMLSQLPAKGEIKLNGTALLIGATFTQDDINTGKVVYANTSSVTTTDSFKVDITNATNGFVPNQEVVINIDSSLGVQDDVFLKAGISIYPTVSNGEFSISATSAIGKMNVEIYTIGGQRVYTSTVNFERGTKQQIFANELATGVYILKLSTTEFSGSKKIIIR